MNGNAMIWIGQLCYCKLFRTFSTALWSIRLSCTELHGLTFAQDLHLPDFGLHSLKKDTTGERNHGLFLNYGDSSTGAGRKINK